MKIQATPLSAAIAGVVAALAWPLIWSRYGGPSQEGSFELVVATLAVIALPAHAFVVGYGLPQRSVSAGTIDPALLKRVGVWLLSALVVTGLRAAMRA